MPSIKCKDVSIRFNVIENKKRSLKNAMVNLAGLRVSSKENDSGFYALKNLGLFVQDGEKVGIVGPNGSGKTTLLRTLSGIYHPSEGSLELNGSVATLLELSSGFDHDATGYENIYLRSVLFGKSKVETSKIVDEIIKFSELEEFIHYPMRTYSSGMIMRLAFSIATSIKPEILLMDEWLSVGDADFNQKATQKLSSLVDQAKILVIASHDLKLISSLCTRIITMADGKIVKDESIV